MEENKVIKEAPKGSYITGIIGAIVGATIASIPWIVVYVEMNYILSLLAAIIGFGALKGYELCKGKMTKAVKVIVAIITIVAVAVSTAYVIPDIYANKNDVDVNVLYDSNEYMSALSSDLIISVIFAILGVTAVFPSINKKLDKSDVIESNSKADDNGQLINEMKLPNQVISSSAEQEKELKQRNLSAVAVWITLIIIIVACIAGASYSQKSNSSSNNNSKTSSTRKSMEEEQEKEFAIQDGKFSLKLTTGWEEVESDYEQVTYLDSKNGASSITITTTSKEQVNSVEELQNMNIDEYGKMLEEYVYGLYEPDTRNSAEKCKVGELDAYKLEFNTVYQGTKFYIVAYCLETENNFVEIYEITLKSKYDSYKQQLEDAVNSFVEVK